MDDELQGFMFPHELARERRHFRLLLGAIVAGAIALHPHTYKYLEKLFERPITVPAGDIPATVISSCEDLRGTSHYLRGADGRAYRVIADGTYAPWTEVVVTLERSIEARVTVLDEAFCGRSRPREYDLGPATLTPR